MVEDPEDIAASDWTEQDLLTRELALKRLAAEEAELTAELEKLRIAPSTDSAALELLQRRLGALEASRANVAPSQPKSLPVSGQDRP